MTDAAVLSSGKGHRDENFPVASKLIAPKHRGAILAFYNFVRAADDVADHATANAGEKLGILDTMLRSLEGRDSASPEGVALRAVCAERKITIQHAADLIEAFRRDCTKLRYTDWDDLLDYCRYSAMPVGRFVLDVHGESPSTWPANDALCAALQIINHLQDCGKDYRDLGRVYIPADALAAAGIGPASLGEAKASKALLSVIAGLAEKTKGLLRQSKAFASQIQDARLGAEVAVIQALAENLNAGLTRRDPLSERVHHNKIEALGLALAAGGGFLAARLFRPVVKPGCCQ